MKDVARVLRTIYAVARERGVSNEELHDTISIGFGKQSLKDLTYQEVGRLLDGLRGKPAAAAIVPDRRRAMGTHGQRGTRSRTEYLVNDSELGMLAEAAALRGWSGETLGAFCERQIGKSQPLTMSEFNKVFWAVKAMNRRDGLFDELQWKRDQARRRTERLSE